MEVATHIPDVIRSMQETLAQAPVVRPMPTTPAVDSKPLLGGEVNIRIALSPGMITLLAGPATVLVTMLAGWVILKSMGMPTYVGEMAGSGIVNILGGIAAALPLFILMKKGAAIIAQASILGIALRCGTVLMGLLLASAPAWGLDRMPLVYWTLACYFPLLIVETTVVAWLCNKARH